MLTYLKKIIRFGKKILFSSLINKGFIRQKTFIINKKPITISSINKSNLLKQIAKNGFESYENEMVTLIKNYPWKMNKFIDIGANIGFFSVLTEIFHPNTKVIAVEPFPKNIEYLKMLKNKNKLSFHLYEKAIDGSLGKKTFF